ncbi:cysteine hydrolase family protein [Paenibacillus cymbidii]|uniref:isochorismatase family protein n=1 Tax=Paenibacillus cymbidii TaxID=1639034 RepID=UPI001081625C|nr:isochorismatase family protein [Paenibacillus cymbidii]
MTRHTTVTLQLQTQRLTQDENGYNVWEKITEKAALTPRNTAVLISDMWDRHWSRGAQERSVQLAARINRFLHAMRGIGVHIVHAPSDTMAFYEGHPARRRLLDTPVAAQPTPKEYPDPPSPIDSSDGGSDTRETKEEIVWTRQTPSIDIDPDNDVVAGDEGSFIYNYLIHHSITRLLYCGVHTNMCVLNRSFGIKRMTRLGINCVLLRDLTDSMYNPAKPPYVSHEEGTRLVAEYIEKFWCPTASSNDVTSR